MPILYHHYPKYTKLDGTYVLIVLPSSYLKSFSVDMKRFLLDITGEVDTFVGLIYSTGDLQETVSVMELNPEKFIVFMGTDEVIIVVIVLFITVSDKF